MTGLDAERIAETVVSPKVKGKLIWARSKDDKSVDPQDWEFLFFDPFADSNGRLVEVQGNAVRRIAEGLLEWQSGRLLSYKETEVIPLYTIRINSNQALAMVQQAAGITQVQPSRVDYVLAADPVNDTPSWQMTIYAFRHDNGEETELGTARISATTGQIFAMKIKPERLH